ncbi:MULTISPECIES: pseudouridine synthase [Rheinheimera]|uniref:pseudouridine synthase n=1 Tax=Rheinheimera TaxID=67575 RepID=UPI00104CC4AB|nr:pseudouridine synthase [Rheinheimera sp. D18]QBL09739.1 rRNA pseudouridine synthase [Rheinheimera sp. D18]
MYKAYTLTPRVTTQRLAKWIAQSGYCSRRAAERLISEGSVSCNGQLGKHTDLVGNADTITIAGKALPAQAEHQYLLYHKPIGIDCNNRPSDPASLYQLLKTLPQRLFAVGRLDKDSSGLLLLTNDGELSQRLMHPDYYHEKTYQVDVDKDINAEFIQKMANGVSWRLGETQYYSRPCLVQQTTTRQFNITLTQGLHRQIRYMCKTLGYRVTALQRLSLHNLQLGNLAAGELRELSVAELTQLQALSLLPQPKT